MTPGTVILYEFIFKVVFVTYTHLYNIINSSCTLHRCFRCFHWARVDKLHRLYVWILIIIFPMAAGTSCLTLSMKNPILAIWEFGATRKMKLLPVKTKSLIAHLRHQSLIKNLWWEWNMGRSLFRFLWKVHRSLRPSPHSSELVLALISPTAVLWENCSYPLKKKKKILGNWENEKK